MDNQHKLIKGYRDLSAKEIELMNKVKEKGAELDKLINEITNHLISQYECAQDLAKIANSQEATAEFERIKAAEPRRWAAVAKTDFQTGLMALVRSIAQPESF